MRKKPRSTSRTRKNNSNKQNSRCRQKAKKPQCEATRVQKSNTEKSNFLQNCEVTIDYEKKKTFFRKSPHNLEDSETRTKAVMGNTKVGIPLMILIGGVILTIFWYQYPKALSFNNFWQTLAEYCLYIAYIASGILAWGLACYIIQHLARNRPEFNLWLSKAWTLGAQSKTIYLNEEKGHGWYKIGNQVVLDDYNVISTKYALLGPCASTIKKVKTLYIGKPGMMPYSADYIMIFEFNKKPEGLIKVTS